ncbi:MAG: hypothetical protein ABL921_31240 [Pirellula sp.]
MTLHFNLAGFIAIPVFVCLSFLNVTANAQVATVADAKSVLDLTVFPAVSPNGHIESTVASRK